MWQLNSSSIILVKEMKGAFLEGMHTTQKLDAKVFNKYLGSLVWAQKYVVEMVLSYHHTKS